MSDTKTKTRKHAFVLLDETGSMQGQEERVCTSMNEYAASLPKGTRLTVFKFDSERWTTHYEGSAKKWKRMTREDYRPGAMTPLYDSIAKAIKHARKNTNKGDRVFVMIDTDGYENASTDYTFEKVKDLIERQKAKGWKFQFMANALTEGHAIRVGAVSVDLGMNYTNAATHVARSGSYKRAATIAAAYLEGDEVPDDAGVTVVDG